MNKTDTPRPLLSRHPYIILLTRFINENKGKIYAFAFKLYKKVPSRGDLIEKFIDSAGVEYI